MAALPNGGHGADFDPEHAALLRDMARSMAPEAQMYNYSEASTSAGPMQNSMAYSEHAYGASHGNAPPYAGFEGGAQEMDPSTQELLQSLADFSHTLPAQENPAPIHETDHFASLLEAAATAGGHEASQESNGQARRSTRQSAAVGQHEGSPAMVPVAQTQGHHAGKRKRGAGDGDNVRMRHDNAKRRRKDDPDQLARQREIWGPDEEDENEHEGDSIFENEQPPPIDLADVKAAGVHSAVALFRRPSQASRKYTRPPMSKLFTSLELTPENFLHLQAAAKNYMLDPDHPERRDCVGNRGRGDTDMVKLKLFGTVKSFLEDEGHGDRYFGEHSDGSETRKLRWPDTKNKLISLVTPLLRRMVTNERQRQYVTEKRHGGGTPKPATTHTIDVPSSSPTRNTPRVSRRDQEPQSRYPEDTNHPTSPYPYPHNLDPAFASEATLDLPSKGREHDRPDTVPADVRTNNDADLSPTQPPTERPSLHLHINILSLTTSQRLLPRTTLSVPGNMDFDSLTQHVRSLLAPVKPTNGREERQVRAIRLLSTRGLVRVSGDDELAAVLQEVEATEWMDRELRVVVDVDDG